VKIEALSAGNDEDLGRSMRSGVEDQRYSSTGRVPVAGRSGGRVTPCVVCIVHMETMSVSFLVMA
jgi:hypothetical protein